MPDILIRGMELESGRIAEILIAPDGNVYRNRREFCLGFGPIAHATKIPPHGDLIDIRTVLEIVMQYVPDDDGSCSKANADLRELLDAIENAPVVVPAERRKPND